MYDILTIMKAMLKITDSEQDEVLLLTIEFVKQQIFNYCNIRELPEELTFTAAMMAVDAYKQMTANDIEGTSVSSVSESGRSVTFDTGTMRLLVEERIEEQKSQLSRFRRLYK